MSRPVPIVLSLCLASSAALPTSARGAWPPAADRSTPGGPATAPPAPVLPPDPIPAYDPVSFEVGDWVLLGPTAVLHSAKGTRALAPAPRPYRISRGPETTTQADGRQQTWYWVRGDGQGWVAADAILQPDFAYGVAQARADSALALDPRGRIDPDRLVARALFEAGEPLRDRPDRNPDPAGPDLAIDDLTDALRIDPGHALAHYLRARAYEGRALPRDEPALADLTEAVRLAPRLLPAYYDRARVYEILAIRLWLQDYLDPDRAAPVPSGRVLAFYRRAFDDMKTVVRLDPSFEDARTRLATLGFEMNAVEVLVKQAAPPIAAPLTLPQAVAPTASAQEPGLPGSPPSPVRPPVQAATNGVTSPPNDWIRGTLAGRPDLEVYLDRMGSVAGGGEPVRPSNQGARGPFDQSGKPDAKGSDKVPPPPAPRSDLPPALPCPGDEKRPQ